MNQYQAVVVISLSEVDGSLSVSMAALCMDAGHGFVMEPRRPTGAHQKLDRHAHAVSPVFCSRCAKRGPTWAGFSTHVRFLVSNGVSSFYGQMSVRPRRGLVSSGSAMVNLQLLDHNVFVEP